MTEVSELVALLSKAERGYTKVLNRSFQNAGYDLSREQYELLEVLWERDHVNQQNLSLIHICTEDLSIIEMLMLIFGHRRIKWNVIRSIWGLPGCFS